MDLEKLFFTQEDAAFIHEQSLKVLAETGCVFDDEKARNVLQKHGARVDGNVVYFTKELVEKGLSTVVDSLELYRPDGTIYQMGHGSKSMCTAGSPPYILEDGKFRFAVMDDYVRICKLVQTSDCLDMTHLNLCDTYDIDRNERAYHMMAALLRYTTLPMSITALMTAKEDTGMVASRLIDMVSQFIGKENNEPVMIGCVSPISPLAYIKEALDALYVYCERNQPIQLAACSLPALTSQASPDGNDHPEQRRASGGDRTDPVIKTGTSNFLWKYFYIHKPEKGFHGTGQQRNSTDLSGNSCDGKILSHAIPYLRSIKTMQSTLTSRQVWNPH